MNTMIALVKAFDLYHSKIKSYSMSMNGEKPYLDTNEYKLNTSKFYSK